MALSELRQSISLINRADRTLLIVPERSSIDAIASMIALYLALQNKSSGSIDEVSPAHVPNVLQFLPGSSQVQTSPLGQTEVILDIASPENIAEIRQEALQGGKRIHITLANNASVDKDQLETSIRPLPYDLIVTIGTNDLEALGSIYTDYTDFFFNTPIINIDHRASNEHFGTVNLVDITAGSTAEVIFELIKHLNNNQLQPTTATALYAGIVAGTESFQKASTTPASFQVAAKLIRAKADREAVIQHIVNTKPLPLLKLSGRLYARLRYNPHQKIYWSIVHTADLSESNASSTDLPLAMHELSKNISNYTAAFVVSESGNSKYIIYLILGEGLRQNKKKIVQQLEGSAENGFIISTINANSLESAEKTALDKIQQILNRTS